MILKAFLGILAAMVTLGLSSCAGEKKRQVVLPQSEESVLPWNRLQPGEAQGQFGAFQQQ